MRTLSAAARTRQKLAPRSAKEVLKVKAVFVEIVLWALIRLVVALGKKILSWKAACGFLIRIMLRFFPFSHIFFSE